MQSRHIQHTQYFDEQVATAKKYLVPFIEGVGSISSKLRILEIGCGRGGNLVPFLERGCEVIALDIDSAKLDQARKFLAGYLEDRQLIILEEDFASFHSHREFDLILLKDTIEHIENKQQLMEGIRRLLSPSGYLFVGFPPWQMPFGGHQQIAKSGLSKLPFIHLLPTMLYRQILRLANEEESLISELLRIRASALTLEAASVLWKTNHLVTIAEAFYLISPTYEMKFNLRPIRLPRIMSKISWLRNYYTTAYWGVFQLSSEQALTLKSKADDLLLDN
jgi:SAM-dependent methyltransferase